MIKSIYRVIVPEKMRRKLRFLTQSYALSLKWQIVRLMRWPVLKSLPLRDLSKYEFKFYSQNGEDGILWALFSKLGTTNKYFVEFGVENGVQCNARLLRENGWRGLMMDGNDGNPPEIKKEFITAENINSLFLKYDVPDEFDLLSIDIDGNDYWVWKQLDPRYRPRILIIEYNAHFPPDICRSIAYDPDFRWQKDDYFGATLGALVKLSNSKGYQLVACDRQGVNAIFVRTDLLKNRIIPKDSKNLYRRPGYGNPRGSGHPRSSRAMIEV